VTVPTTVTRSAHPAAPAGRLERWFDIPERGTTVRREISAGVVTFLTMSYILFVNAQILGGVEDASGARLDFGQVLTVTALAAGVATIAMGLVGRYPYGLAAGLGLNAFVAFSLVGAQQLSWADAMGVIVTEGLIITLFVLTGVREAVMNAIPKDLRLAIGIGIGLFIMFIGLANAGIVVRGEGTLVDINSDLQRWPVLVFVIGLVLTGVMVARQIKGALLFGILGTTVLATVVNELKDGTVWANGIASVPEKVTAVPDFNLVGNFSFDFFGALGVWTAAAVVLSVMLSDFFDTTGTITALGAEADQLDGEGKLPGAKRVLLVDSLAATLGGAVSASSNTTYIESASGIAEGGRTGLTAVVTGVLFLACLFISPLAGVIPPEAVAPALVIVAFFMMAQVGNIRWREFHVGFPALLTIAVMPFTFSITNGVGIGFIFFTLLSLLSGKRREVSWMMVVVSGIFAWYFIHGTL
jgi:adenine/guanine/hypoxanthine permease